MVLPSCHHKPDSFHPLAPLSSRSYAKGCICRENSGGNNWHRYEYLMPGFERSPTDPLNLLLLKDIRRTLGR